MESASSSRANKIKAKGRGHTESNDEGKYDGRDGVFESIGRGGGGDGGPLQCKLLTCSKFFCESHFSRVV